MTPFDEMAADAAKAARNLLQLGDRRGAISRGYYAIYNAARAALNAREAGLGNAKSHKTIISRFSLHLVKTGAVDARLARSFTRSFDTRITAEYNNDDIDIEAAEAVVAMAEEFVASVAEYLKSRTP
jgi:uncharacterized protein (UPF0332 family)